MWASGARSIPRVRPRIIRASNVTDPSSNTLEPPAAPGRFGGCRHRGALPPTATGSHEHSQPGRRPVGQQNVIRALLVTGNVAEFRRIPGLDLIEY